jgi:hypothetical protein
LAAEIYYSLTAMLNGNYKTAFVPEILDWIPMPAVSPVDRQQLIRIFKM